MQLVLLQQQFHGVFDAHITHEDRGFHVRAQVLVEDEVQAGDLGQHFEDGLEVGVAKFQGHRPVQAGTQLWVLHHVAALHQADAVLQFPGTLVLRVQFENLLDLAVGTVDVTATQVATGHFEFLIHAAQVVELAQGILGTTVVRFDVQDPAVSHAGPGEITLGAVHVGLGQQRRHGAGPSAVESHVQFGIARVFPQSFFDARQTGFILARFDQGRSFIPGNLRRTACGQPRAETKAHQQTGFVHSVLPTDKVCAKCRGR
ncbi:hypothetical protein D3C81_1413520 [compost metagenome]